MTQILLASQTRFGSETLWRFLAESSFHVTLTNRLRDIFSPPITEAFDLVVLEVSALKTQWATDLLWSKSQDQIKPIVAVTAAGPDDTVPHFELVAITSGRRMMTRACRLAELLDVINEILAPNAQPAVL